MLILIWVLCCCTLLICVHVLHRIVPFFHLFWQIVVGTKHNLLVVLRLRTTTGLLLIIVIIVTHS